MKVTYKNKTIPMVRFSDLKIGDFFIQEGVENTIWMKIESKVKGVSNCVAVSGTFVGSHGSCLGAVEYIKIDVLEMIVEKS